MEKSGIFLERLISEYKSPKAGVFLTDLKNSKEATVSGSKLAKEQWSVTRLER